MRHTLPLKIGTRLDPCADPGDLRLRQAALAPAARAILKAIEALHIVAQHPVAQICSSMPCARAASVRDAPSMIMAIARAREVCFASPQRFASSWSSFAV